MVELKYSLTTPDLVACGLHLQASSGVKPGPFTRKLRWLSGLLFLTVFGLLLFGAANDIARAVGVGAFVLLCLMNHPSVRHSILEEHVASQYSAIGNEIFVGERTLTTTPVGFTVAGVLSESRYPWSTLFRAARTSTHIFLYVAPISAHPIPLASLPAEQLSEFWAVLTAAVPPEKVVSAGA